MDRRYLLKTLGGSAAALPILAQAAGCRPAEPAAPIQGPAWTGPAGTLSDPDLVHPKTPWEKVMTAGELTVLTALCDTIIPADDRSPAASAVGVPDFINEWASAPYDYQRGGLAQIRAGLTWLDAEATRRFRKTFAQLGEPERNRICDDICYEPRAKPKFKVAAKCFDLVRDLAATGFYTTTEGMKDLQYIGNVALPKFDGPPPEVLKHLGIA